MRLIDADALTKDLCENYIFTGFNELLDDFASAIRAQPTVDAVPVIRCKDCRHYDKSDDTPYCQRAMWWQDEGDDWFCAGAERRDNDSN